MIRSLGPRLQDPSIWHINRRSVSGGVALGLFCCFIPLPIQMILSAVGAIFFRVNILISVATVWITNPITIPPMFYFCYLVGKWLLGDPPDEFEIELSFSWLTNEFLSVWKPLLLGCFTVASISSICGFLLVRILWHYHLLQQIKLRKQRFSRRKAERNKHQS